MSDFSLGIPNRQNWPEKSFADISTVLRRGTAPSYVAASPVRVIGQRCVQDSGFQANKARPHDPKLIEGSLVAQEGDVLINSTGSGTIGRSCVFRAHGLFVVDSHITVIRPREGIDPEWINLMLRSPWGQRRLESHCFAGSTNQIELSRHQLASTTIPVPSWGVQRKIVALLDSLSEAERGIEASIAKLRTARDAIFSRAVESAAYGAQATRTVSLGSLLERMEAGWSPACDTEPPRRGEWGVVRVSAVTSGRFASHKSKRLPPELSPRPDLEIRCGDLLMARANGARNLVGTVCLVGENPGRLMLSDKTLRLLPKEGMASADFLSIALSAESVRNQIEAMLSGSTGQGNISQTAVRSIVVPKISVREQRKIVKLVGSVDRNIANETGELAKLCELKSGLVDDLLTGRVAVSVARG